MAPLSLRAAQKVAVPVWLEYASAKEALVYSTVPPGILARRSQRWFSKAVGASVPYPGLD
jgi:hypothetical protein